MAGSADSGRRDLVAWRIAARHDEHSRALVSQLLVGSAVQRSPARNRLRRRARCRTVECARGRHLISDARPVFDLPIGTTTTTTLLTRRTRRARGTELAWCSVASFRASQVMSV